MALCALTLSAQQGVPTALPATVAVREYRGVSVPGVDPSTLVGKVVTGYQGWFNAPGDGSGRGWAHFGRDGEFDAETCSIDLWPDVSELSQDERYTTEFSGRDGRPAKVFSSYNTTTVARHFQWMQQYGIDGVFVQRFAAMTRWASTMQHCNRVLTNCRAAANQYGRGYAVMYDLSGLSKGETQLVIDDWKALQDTYRLGRGGDRAYWHHGGKPVVGVLGVGFGDGRKYTLDECERLVRFFQEDPDYGGNTVVLGVPTYWRTLRRDAVRDGKLHRLAELADIVSPWTVGRYSNVKAVDRYAAETMQPDIAWCRARQRDYLPVVFPGFSWHNQKPSAPLAQIPRKRGAFLWRQIAAARSSGATMVYVAMFDGMDEGTAIFKCSQKPPLGASFLTFEGLPSDHYLWLTGMAGKMLRGEIGEGMPRLR